MRLILCSRCIPRNYQTNLIVNPAALKQPKILFNKPWVSLIQLRYNGDISNHLPSRRPCNLRGYAHKTGLCNLGWSMKVVLGFAGGVTQTVWNEAVTAQSLRSRVRARNYKWHVNPGAFSNNFLRRGWGPLVSSLSSLTGLWGVIYASMEV